MDAQDAIRTLRIELTKARVDYYPDRRNALREALRALSEKAEKDSDK